jgi:hypothetical protein
MDAIIPAGWYWSRARRDMFSVIFRVEAEYPNGCSWTPGFDDNQNLCSRGPRTEPTYGAAKLHLTWSHHWPYSEQPFESPYISFFTKYRTALRRKDWFLTNGAGRVNILAYDSSHMTDLIDCGRLARLLGQTCPKILNRLHLFSDEVLATSQIMSDDYSLLAILPASNGWEEDIPVGDAAVTVTRDFRQAYNHVFGIVDILQLEIYSHTGLRYDDRLRTLLHAMHR